MVFGIFLNEEIVYRKKRGFPDALLPEVEAKEY